MLNTLSGAKPAEVLIDEMIPFLVISGKWIAKMYNNRQGIG